MANNGNLVGEIIPLWSKNKSLSLQPNLQVVGPDKNGNIRFKETVVGKVKWTIAEFGKSTVSYNMDLKHHRYIRPLIREGKMEKAFTDGKIIPQSRGTGQFSGLCLVTKFSLSYEPTREVNDSKTNTTKTMPSKYPWHVHIVNGWAKPRKKGNLTEWDEPLKGESNMDFYATTVDMNDRMEVINDYINAFRMAMVVPQLQKQIPEWDKICADKRKNAAQRDAGYQQVQPEAYQQYAQPQDPQPPATEPPQQEVPYEPPVEQMEPPVAENSVPGMKWPTERPPKAQYVTCVPHGEITDLEYGQHKITIAVKGNDWDLYFNGPVPEKAKTSLLTGNPWQAWLFQANGQTWFWSE